MLCAEWDNPACVDVVGDYLEGKVEPLTSGVQKLSSTCQPG